MNTQLLENIQVQYVTESGKINHACRHIVAIILRNPHGIN